MTDAPFISIQGWPCEFEESPVGTGLIKAIRAVPGGEALADSTTVDLARLLYAVAEGGRDEELPRNRPASQKASEAEIRKLAEMSERLADHLEAMRRPAISAITQEGIFPFDLVHVLRATIEQTKRAFSEIDITDTPAGAPQKVAAAEVALMASRIFEQITDRRPTFTTDPATGHVSGLWPDFLAAIYDALAISASVASQVRAVSEKSRAF